ncbi:hypothetical protein ACMYSO_23000 [Klebsiella sp. B345]|uniref:hypothetical protein n=1 Tax=Klebsiella sp. B345 TaxID=2755398 RepID=UPI003DA91C79
MVRRLPTGDSNLPATTAADTFADIPDERKRAIRDEVMQDYFKRVAAVKKQLDAMTVAQREMFHRSLAESLALVGKGDMANE